MASTTPVTTLEEFTLPPVRVLDPFGDYRLTRSVPINNNKENTKTSTRKNGKRGRMPIMAEKKKEEEEEEEERNDTQFPLTRKTLSPFIGAALARKHCNL